MTVYKIENGQVTPVERTSFAQQGLRERSDIQRMFKAQIEILSPDTLVVAEEFGDWEDSRRRIDLLGLDRNANLVVIELKRTEDAGHLELQAIRYAAMISTITFDELVTIHGRYLEANATPGDAADRLLSFLGWEEPDEERFGQEVRIVLAAADFSREVMSSVMWLRDYGLDIRCVRMHPYVDDGRIYLDVETLIPLPQVESYQVRISAKKQKERESRESTRDLTRFDVQVAGQRFDGEPKRWVMFRLIAALISNGASPERIAEAIPWRSGHLFEVFDGVLDSEQVQQRLTAKNAGGSIPRSRRYFSGAGEPFHYAGKTYVLSNQWGRRTREAVDNLQVAFPELGIAIAESLADRI